MKNNSLLSLQLFQSMRGRLIACSCASVLLMHVSLPPEILVIDKFHAWQKVVISVKGFIAQVNKFHLLLMTNFTTSKNYPLNKKSYSDITKVQMTKQLLCNLKAVFPIKWCASLPLFCKNSMCNVCAYCWQDFKCVCSMGFFFHFSEILH